MLHFTDITVTTNNAVPPPVGCGRWQRSRRRFPHGISSEIPVTSFSIHVIFSAPSTIYRYRNFKEAMTTSLLIYSPFTVSISHSITYEFETTPLNI
jgi:hypothetical protein